MLQLTFAARLSGHQTQSYRWSSSRVTCRDACCRRVYRRCVSVRFVFFFMYALGIIVKRIFFFLFIPIFAFFKCFPPIFFSFTFLKAALLSVCFVTIKSPFHYPLSHPWEYDVCLVSLFWQPALCLFVVKFSLIFLSLFSQFPLHFSFFSGANIFCVFRFLSHALREESVLPGTHPLQSPAVSLLQCGLRRSIAVQRRDGPEGSKHPAFTDDTYR